jgi:hypothetical protein
MAESEIAQETVLGAPKPSLVVEIRKEFKQGLDGSNTVVRQQIVADLTKKEVQRRAEATQKVFDLCEAAQGEIRKIKPTHSGYGLNGQPVGDPVYTQDQAKQHKELTEKIARFESALRKALEDNDFTKVFELGR